MRKTLLMLAVLAATVFTSCDLTSTYTVRVMPNIYYTPDSGSNISQNIYVMQKMVEQEFLYYANYDMIVGYTIQKIDIPTAKVNETYDILYKELKAHYDKVHPKVLAFDYSTIFDTTVVQNVGFTLVAAWSDSTIYAVRVVLPDTTKVK